MSDLLEVQKIVKEIAGTGPDAVSNPIRLGAKTKDKGRMIKFTVKDEKSKYEILKNAPKLSKNKDRKEVLYINPDYTPKERETLRNLRQEKRSREEAGEKDLVIKNFKITKRNSRPHNTVTNSRGYGQNRASPQKGELGSH